ncbi:MAG TPA: hypothetical protein VHL57_12960 [Flavobacteriales bacterium]|jgi:cell division protein FtsQ|nr:hypothetical protein [Flavobacteriales bacterium]
MSKLKRLLRPIAMVLGAFAVVGLLGFVEVHADRTPVKELAVSVKGEEGMHFIDENTVRAQVLQGTDGVIGSAVGATDITGIEHELRGLGCVSKAEVYHTMDGVLHVRVEQRRPIVRVINADGSGFYIDQDGWTMPLSEAYTARVLVVTGELTEPFAKVGPLQVTTLGDSLRSLTRSADIFAMARTITADPLWNALFEQAVVDVNGDMDLIPRIGAQRVRVGDGTNLERRLAKLKTFYAQGIPQADWRRYSAIDLRFDDQVVCTKRP